MKGIVGQIMTNNLCSLLAGPLTGNDIFAHLPATTVADQNVRTTNNILADPLIGNDVNKRYVHDVTPLFPIHMYSSMKIKHSFMVHDSLFKLYELDK